MRYEKKGRYLSAVVSILLIWSALFSLAGCGGTKREMKAVRIRRKTVF